MISAKIVDRLAVCTVEPSGSFTLSVVFAMRRRARPSENETPNLYLTYMSVPSRPLFSSKRRRISGGRSFASMTFRSSGGFISSSRFRSDSDMSCKTRGVRRSRI
jgi:hypothetical protein